MNCPETHKQLPFILVFIGRRSEQKLSKRVRTICCKGSDNSIKNRAGTPTVCSVLRQKVPGPKPLEDRRFAENYGHVLRHIQIRSPLNRDLGAQAADQLAIKLLGEGKGPEDDSDCLISQIRGEKRRQRARVVFKWMIKAIGDPLLLNETPDKVAPRPGKLGKRFTYVADDGIAGSEWYFLHNAKLPRDKDY